MRFPHSMPLLSHGIGADNSMRLSKTGRKREHAAARLEPVVCERNVS